MGWISTHFCLLMDLSTSCYWFDLMVGFSFSTRSCFSWGTPFCCSASNTLYNVDTPSSILLFILWNLIVSLLLYHRTLLLSWVMSLSITVHYTQEFRSFSTSGNTDTKLDDNEVGSTGSRYLSTPFQDGKGMTSSSSVPHKHTDAYKAAVFYRFVASPPHVRNTTFSFILLSF